MLRPQVVLDILGSFSLFATDKKRRKIKVICRYQQYLAANQIVERVLVGLVRKGLIWHFQGSGKSLLMVFAAQKLRLHPALKNPTVIIVVDRIDLDTQITATFNTVDVPNIIPAESRGELQQLLAQDVRKIIEIEINIIARIRRHSKNPKFIALGQRLEDLKERHEKGLLTSLAFLKLLLELAKDVVAAEKEVVPAREQDRGKAALTELFKQAKNAKTPVMVERIVNDIDAIVRAVRFDGWQQTTGGEREIRKALRSTLLKYQLHREQELFDRAYEYIREYY